MTREGHTIQFGPAQGWAQLQGAVTTTQGQSPGLVFPPPTKQASVLLLVIE